MSERLPTITTEKTESLASPLDRLAANVLDGLIVGILIGLITAPFHYQVQMEELLLRPGRIEMWGACATLASLFTYIIYFIFTVQLMGASLGQKFIGIKIVDIWTGERPSLTEICVRAVSRCVTLVTVVPLLGVFSDPKRRLLHDRISNTIVISSNNRSVGAPTHHERTAVRIGMAGLGLGVASFLTVAAVQTIQHGKKGRPRIGFHPKAEKRRIGARRFQTPFWIGSPKVPPLLIGSILR